MKKYQDALLEAINHQLEEWLEKQVEPVAYEDVYRFLHSIRGTSGTIGMHELSAAVRVLMGNLAEMDTELMSAGEVRRFLLPLLAVCSAEGQGPAAMEVAAGTTVDIHAPDHLEQPIVLALDTDAAFLIKLKTELESRGYLVLATTMPQKAISFLHDFEPDCIVLEPVMNDPASYDAFLSLREKLRQRFIPTTMISGNNEKSMRIQAYRLGADYFAAKPLDMSEFTACLERQLDRKRMVDKLLTYDELTGALKSKLMEEIYREHMQALSKHGMAFSLALVDVDGLEEINAAYGPLSGDQVLRAVTRHFKDSLPERYTILRSKGGSFLIFLKNMPAQEAVLELKAALDSFAAFVFKSESTAFRASCSAGVVGADEPGKQVSYWIDRARHALHAAKAVGCGRAAGFNKEDLSSSIHTIRIAIVVDDEALCMAISKQVRPCFPKEIDVDIHFYQDGETFLADEWSRSGYSYLVLLDCKAKPGGSGFEILRRLRGLKAASKYTVLMLTGSDAGRDAAKALQLGTDDYITKSFTIREMQGRIRYLAKKMV